MKFINIHTHHKTENVTTTNIYNKKIDEINSETYFSSGIHPWYIDNDNLKNQFKIVANDLSKKRCLALGECGLDKLINTNFELQQKAFLQQLELNKKHQKPVILHCVKSFQEIIKIKEQFNFPFIIHGFNKKIELANQLINKDFFLSFGKHLLVNKNLQETFNQLPLDKLFLETDDASISIESVYKKAAEIKNISLEILILEIQNNFKLVFK